MIYNDRVSCNLNKFLDSLYPKQGNKKERMNEINPIPDAWFNLSSRNETEFECRLHSIVCMSRW